MAFRIVRGGEADPKRSATETLNLSASGLCLVSPAPLEQNTDLALELSLKGRQEPVLAMGRVVWCDSAGDAYRVGISFSWVREQDRAALALIADYVQERQADA